MNAHIKKINTKCNKCCALLTKNTIVVNRRCCKSCLSKSNNKTPIVKNYNIENVSNKAERTLIIGNSGCGKTTLMLDILKKYDPNSVYIVSKTEDQYPLKYKNQSTEIEPLEHYEDANLIFDDMLGSKQARDIDQFFCRGRHHNINIFYISQSWYALPKNTIRNNSSVICIFQQTKTDVQSLYRDVAGLDMGYHEYLNFCREAWGKPYNYIQINRHEPFENRYSI